MNERNDSGFKLLDELLQSNASKKYFYWLAAIMFWSGVLLTIEYYFAQTGTEPSWFPGCMMLIGIGIYGGVRHFR